MRGDEALAALLEMEFELVFDIGSGAGYQAEVMRKAGKQVVTIDNHHPADIQKDFMALKKTAAPDAIWCCHVLEHQRNVGAFLERCFYHLASNGILAITVPPRKDEIVGGHVSLWNAGLLVYNVVLAGFDCRDAKVWTYGYNISLIVRKKKANIPPLSNGRGDIERLSELFPVPVRHGFNGAEYEVN